MKYSLSQFLYLGICLVITKFIVPKARLIRIPVDIRGKKFIEFGTGLTTGYAWLDTGTHASLLDASNFVRTLTERQGLQVGSPDEVAYQLDWISRDQLSKRSELFGKNKYGQDLSKLVK